MIPIEGFVPQLLIHAKTKPSQIARTHLPIQAILHPFAQSVDSAAEKKNAHLSILPGGQFNCRQQIDYSSAASSASSSVNKPSYNALPIIRLSTPNSSNSLTE